MKKSIVAWFVILTVSDVYCTISHNCYIDFTICESDSDCCSHDCLLVDKSNGSYCRPQSEMTMEKIQEGECAYYNPVNEIEEKNHRTLEESFGLYFATHPLLPTNTMIEVEHDGHYVNVVISNQPMKNGSSHALLELSRDAAMVLGITEEGLTECNIQLITAPNPNSYPLLKPIIIIVLYIATIAIIA